MFSLIELQVWGLQISSVSSQYVLSYRFWNYKVRTTRFDGYNIRFMRLHVMRLQVCGYSVSKQYDLGLQDLTYRFKDYKFRGYSL